MNFIAKDIQSSVLSCAFSLYAQETLQLQIEDTQNYPLGMRSAFRWKALYKRCRWEGNDKKNSARALTLSK
ncbi:hypothetical protein [Capnocytophaga ochracea]|uniref:hypothetical protein n=1 Tax=Capnocytophaga ochracea TaxID=1018 RepID=UPI000FE1F45F|nr:hypothetical protein [Capnocytophaga ochracea]